MSVKIYIYIYMFFEIDETHKTHTSVVKVTSFITDNGSWQPLA